MISKTLELIQKWTQQENDHTERWCGRCKAYQEVVQKDVDEVCVYVCDACNNVIDENDTPF